MRNNNKTASVNVYIKEKEKKVIAKIPVDLPNEVVEKIIDNVKKSTTEYLQSGFELVIQRTDEDTEYIEIDMPIEIACKKREAFISKAGGDFDNLDVLGVVEAAVKVAEHMPRKASELLQEIGYDKAHANLITSVANKVLNVRDDETLLVFGGLAVFFQAFLAKDIASVAKTIAMAAYLLTFDELIGFVALLDKLTNDKYRFFEGFDSDPADFVKPVFVIKNHAKFYKKLKKFSLDTIKKECENAKNTKNTTGKKA